MAAQALVDAAIAFCEDSQVLRELLDPVATKVGEAQYEFDAPANQELVRVLGIWADGQLLQPVAAEQANYAAQADGRPSSYFVLRQDEVLTVQLYPTPLTVQELKVEVALKPTREATQLPNDLFTFWLDAVLAGALARLLALPSASFANPAAAVFNMNRAHTLTAKARLEGTRGRLRTSLRVIPRPFA